MWFAATYVDLPDCVAASVEEGEMLPGRSGASCSGLRAETESWAERLALVGRAVFRAFRYRPQALQIVDPVGERRHSGVCVVPQLLGSNVSFCVHTAQPWRCEQSRLTCTFDPSLVGSLEAHTVTRTFDPEI